MSDELRYPIGKFVAPDELDPALIAGPIRELMALPERMREAVNGLDDEQLDTPYREGGWTLRQVVHHVADSHMHAYMRTKFALTEESPAIKAYEESDWADLPDARSLPPAPSLAILDGVHRRWVSLLETLDPTEWERPYFHPQYQVLWPVWRVVALYAWHSRHHVAQITELRRRKNW